MLAIQVRDDDRHSLQLADFPDPVYRRHEVLLRVHATAVNRVDILQRRGLYPPPPGESPILGMEAAGEIVALGKHVTGWKVGDRVFCLLGGGGYAELVTVHPEMLLRLPSGWSFTQAAAIPEVFYSAFLNLFLEAKLKSREIVLVHAGASGVGTAAIQLARQAGALVIVTAGTDEKIQQCVMLGANHGVNYRKDDFVERVGKITNQAGVHVILDCIGAAYLERNLSLLQTQGRLVLIGLMGGAKAEMDLALLLRKRLRVIGSVLRSRGLQEKIKLTQLFREKVMPQFENGSLQPVIDRAFPLAEAEAAHECLRANLNVGKVVLEVG
ncbi:MAG: NAD(P)H-quinone oxidoreductase [bacterium]